jgi:hypothetical protein
MRDITISGKAMKRTLFVAVAVVAVVLLGAGSCDEEQTNAQKAAQDKAANGETYIPKNDIERRNYNARTELADNPASLIWCSVYPSNPNVKAFTVPIVGKLTSGGKRPYPTEIVRKGDETSYFPEFPDPNGMYGSSADYKYGFDPAGNYHEFIDIEMRCTSVPSIIQQQTTQLEINVDGDLSLIDSKVQAALKACRDRDPDPSHACPEAARLLGM